MFHLEKRSRHSICVGNFVFQIEYSSGKNQFFLHISVCVLLVDFACLNVWVYDTWMFLLVCLLIGVEVCVHWYLHSNEDVYTPMTMCTDQWGCVHTSTHQWRCIHTNDDVIVPITMYTHKGWCIHTNYDVYAPMTMYTHQSRCIRTNKSVWDIPLLYPLILCRTISSFPFSLALIVQLCCRRTCCQSDVAMRALFPQLRLPQHPHIPTPPMPHTPHIPTLPTPHIPTTCGRAMGFHFHVCSFLRTHMRTHTLTHTHTRARDPQKRSPSTPLLAR